MACSGCVCKGCVCFCVTICSLHHLRACREGHEQAFTEMLQFMEAEFPSVYETLAVEKVSSS